MKRCPVCGAARRLAFEALALERHPARFLKCDGCGFLAVEDPTWLEEAYRSVIAMADTGVLSRARDLESRLISLIMLVYGPHALHVDVGGGYGALVRTMRDAGLDFRWSDPYCENLLAQGFEHRGEPVTLATLIEVLEHAVDPLGFLRDVLATTGARTVVVTTELLPEPVPDPSEWWYYTLSTGQHLSFFERRTLDVMAEKLGLAVHSRANLHVFHRGEVKDRHFLVAATRLARAAAVILGRRLTPLADNPLLAADGGSTSATADEAPNRPAEDA